MTNKQKIFQKKILDYYINNKRIFPWRDISDPYKIMVSEFMLQQTQTSRVIAKYEKFIHMFPTLQSLAKAKNTDVLKLWSGLGYNRRALYLKTAAEKLHEHSDFSVENLVSIKGIGKNTAGAIFVFSYNRPYIFIETNIRRVFIHEFFANKQAVADTEIFKLIEKTLDYKNPRDWYYALMDYGAFLSKTEINPNRKSKHYNKQSKFEGSIRQVRGKILKQLIEKSKIKIEELEKIVNSVHLKKALAQLEKEGFIEIKNKNISLQ